MQMLKHLKASGSEDIKALTKKVSTMVFLADVYAEKGDNLRLLPTLNKAYKIQNLLLQKIRNRSRDVIEEHTSLAAELAFRIGMAYLNKTDKAEKAESAFKDALQFNSTHEKALLELAKLNFKKGDYDTCRANLELHIRLCPDHAEAASILASVEQTGNAFSAVEHFKGVLENDPCNFQALRKMIRFLWFAGRLAEAKQFVEKAEAVNRVGLATGLHFCKGLMAWWYENDPRKALIHFNEAREDRQWGKEALILQIKIYINPDHSSLFMDCVATNADTESHLEAAKSLLLELEDIVGNKSRDVHLLWAYICMREGGNELLAKARSTLTSLLKTNKDYIPAQMGMADLAHINDEETICVETLEKIVEKTSVVSEFTVEYQNALLMLAKKQMYNAKEESARGLIHRCLDLNKSSAKAWELFGQLAQREQKWKEASENYFAAWTLLNESVPAIGYCLAFTYLKAGQNVNAIDVCHTVLKQEPEFPNISDVLHKARQGLRP